MQQQTMKNYWHLLLTPQQRYYLQLLHCLHPNENYRQMNQDQYYHNDYVRKELTAAAPRIAEITALVVDARLGGIVLLG